MELFDFIKILFESPDKFNIINAGEKRKHFFMVNRRMSISYPLQAQALQHICINEAETINFWQKFLLKYKGKTPYWIYTKGVKKQIEKKESVQIKDSLLREYASTHNIDVKSLVEAMNIFPEELKKEINKFKKYE